MRTSFDLGWVRFGVARRAWLALLLAIVLPGVGGGCRTSAPASASFASVTISNRSVDEIRRVTVEVFAQKGGYHAILGGGDEMLFEREGTRGNEIAYGNWVGGSSVINRVRARVVELAPGQARLQCHAFMVRSPHDPVMEEEIRLQNIRSRPYQALLDEVAARLK